MSFAAPARWQRGLYFVTPETADTPALLALAERALAGGAALLQYRSKSPDAALRHAQASSLRELACVSCVPLIVNDDVGLAHAVAADGVHLGRDDGDIAQARASLGTEAIIGVSCYDSLDRARAAAAAGASYIAFGAMFPSPTKPHATHSPLSLLRDSGALDVPRVAIGGITLDNARSVIDAGADLVAVVSAIAEAEDPRRTAALFAALFDTDGPAA